MTSAQRNSRPPRDQLAFCGPAALLDSEGVPRLARAMILLGAAGLAAALAWAGTARLDEVSVTQGQILPAGSVRVVQHLEGGIVRDILARDGDLVEAGQTLVRLDPVASAADLAAARTAAAALALRAERLRAVVEGRAPNFDAVGDHPELVAAELDLMSAATASRKQQQQVLDAEIAEKAAEVRVLEERRAAAAQQVALAREELALRETLYEERLLSKIVYLETQRAVAGADAELAETIAAIAKLGKEVTSAEERRAELDARLDHEAAEELGAVERELAEVRAGLARLEDRVARLDVVAPVRGIVKGLAVTTIGGVLAPGAEVLQIVPVAETLVAETRLSPRDAGAVRAGQRARVGVSAYDPHRYGYATGRVLDVSATTFVDDEGLPYYRVRIALDGDTVGEDGPLGPLLPGMTVQADIATGERTVLAYLLTPVYDSLDGAFRER
jgi:HlyD family secretion protein/adhesin transport system membrane fusion protein